MTYGRNSKVASLLNTEKNKKPYLIRGRAFKLKST